MRIEVAETASRLAEVEIAWRALWARCDADIFQSHGWIQAWVDGAAPLHVRIGLAWEGSALVAVFPCAVRRRNGLRQLEWAAVDASDYCDAMVDPATARRPVLEALWRAIHDAGGFDLFRLQQVRPDATVHVLLDVNSASMRGLHQEPRKVSCMRIDRLWPNGEAFFRSLNKKGRNNHTRGKRILGELGGEVVFRAHDSDAPVGPVLDRIMELKRDWLRVHDPESSLLGSGAATHRAMLEAAWRTGIMRVFLLESGDRLAAASINFLHDTRMQAYLTSYDPEFERASPGTILIVEYTKWAFDRGIDVVDLMRGEEEFKSRMTNATTLLEGFIGARTLLGRSALWAWNWRNRMQERTDSRHAGGLAGDNPSQPAKAGQPEHHAPAAATPQERRADNLAGGHSAAPVMMRQAPGLATRAAEGPPLA
jgi:CelD/BcsL family acetyltransferase involved in cellulose biosynthesis